MMKNIDDAVVISSDLLTFSVQPNIEGVHRALSSISTTVSTNGRVLEQTIQQHHSMRMEMTSANDRLQAELNRERTARQELESRLASLQSAVRSLENTAARRDALQVVEQDVNRRLHSLEGRTSMVERGECTTLVSSVYNACTTAMVKRVGEVEEELTIRLDEASEGIYRQIADQQEDHAANIDASVTARLDKMHEDTEARIRKYGEDLTARHTHLDARITDSEEYLNTRLLRTKDDLSAAICTGLERMSRWVTVGDHALDALFGILCLDKGTCVEMWNSTRGVGPERPITSAPPLRLAPRGGWNPVPEVQPEVEEAEEGEEEVTLSDEAIRRLAEAANEQQHSDELREIVVRHTTPLAPKATANRPPSTDEVPSALDSASDPRVRYLSHTPHAVAMRAGMQREMSSRVEVLRSELQHDMVSELLELQREVKGKVTSTKLGEMLTQFRDNQLYNTVKLLAGDLQDVKSNKLDTHAFYEAVKVKADTRALESKVSHEDMETQLSAVGDSTARLMRDLSRVHERSRQTEIALRNLQTYVLAGGGVYATKQALDAKLDGMGGSVIVLKPNSSVSTVETSPISARTKEAREALSTSVDAASVLNNSAAASALKQQVVKERDVQQRIRQGTLQHRTSDASSQEFSSPQGAALLAGVDAYNNALRAVDESIPLATALVATRAAKAEELSGLLQMELGPESIESYLLPDQVVSDQTLLHSGFVADSETCLRDSAEWQLAARQASDQLIRPPTAPKVPPRVRSATQGKRAPLPSQIRHAASSSSPSPVNLHLGGFPRPGSALPAPTAPIVPSMPLTKGQIDYCDQLGLERAPTGKVLQQARPGDLAREVKKPAPKRVPPPRL